MILRKASSVCVCGYFFIFSARTSPAYGLAYYRFLGGKRANTMERTRLLSVAVCLLALTTLSIAQGTSPPKITGQSPSYYVVLSKEPTEIECVADGTPAPTYHWQKDGADLEIADPYSLNGGNLQVRRPVEATNGIYRCYATNAYGVAMSNKIDFQIAFTDAFVDKEKATFRFNEGDVATIPCNQPDSVPLPSIFWTDDANPGNKIPLNNRVSIDPNFNLRFSNINTTDTGNYQCNVKNDKMRLQLLSPVKEVVVIPVENIETRPATFVYTPPASVDAFRTEKLRLKCMAEGYPTPVITFTKDGESLPADRTSYESYGQELVISDVMASDVGSYMCTASNGGGTPTAFTITVTVKSKPYWENKPEDTNIVINEGGVLDCSAEGIPVPMVTWLINGVPFKEAEANPRLTITEGIGGGRVELTNAITEDSAVFVCVASNEYGEIFASGFVNVESIPAEMTDAPQRNLNSIEGRAFDLTCAGQGSPKPTIQWTFQNNPIVHGESKYSIVEDGNTRSTTSTLTVTGVGVEDSGDYKCIIENGFAAVEATSTVNVRRGTTIVVGPGAEVSVELGADAIIACEVDHDAALEPTVTWSRNVGAGEEELDLTVPGGRFRRAKTGSDNLKVVATVGEDTGTYKCKAVTTEDEASASTELVIKTVPSPPSKPIVSKRSDISDTMVAVAWNSGDDGNSPITDYIVSRMTNFADLGWVVESTVPAASTQASLDLSPYVTYWFRVVAVNAIGESQPSELSDEYTTAAAAITETPEEVGLEATDPGKLKVTWPEVHPYDQNGPGFKYVVRWREAGTSDDWTPHNIDDYRTTSYEIDGGDIYKELEVEVVYVNDLGEGPASEKSGFTGEGTPTEAPQNVQVVADSPTEVVITWDEVPASSINGMLQKFLVYYTMVEAQAQGQEPAECLPNTDCRVGDLTPYMNYQFRVAVRNGQREGEKSAPVSFQMPEGESGPVYEMSIVPLSDRIMVKWGKPASPNGVIKGYNLSYNTFDGNDLGEETRVPIGDPEADSYKVESAQPDTNYRISVYATNGYGLGQATTQEIKTRVGGEPPKPLLADAQIAPGKTYINVTFVQKDEGAAANEFYVLYKEANDPEAEYQETKRVDLLDKSMTNVPELEPGTEYLLTIVAVNDAGEVSGDEEKVKTLAGAAQRASPIYVQGWFIVLLIIIVALLCILLVLCILKSQRGGKYNVSDKEQQRKGDIESTPLKDEDGFEEFEPSKDNKDGELPRGSQGSLQPSEPGSSDTDSLKEYADGELGKFNEEGSFIGQYGDKKQRPTDDTDQGGAAYSTFV
ncbi:neuronal cell adhesion molecule-like isoform X2 [Patiria miniata]|uniref:Neuronal cell adhesion molecule n=1 Tax=Patiria miniata TaxID=46514 RepID=A0A913ZR24_PATMI|nr:neuronal cell adhesion molecule-like isoform X2 [Patiria miniata]